MSIEQGWNDNDMGMRNFRIIYKYPVRTAQKTHCVPVIQTSQLMLYREIIAFCSEIHTKHINTAVWAERRIAEC